MEQIKYYLVLEKRLGDYNLVDINKLDICALDIPNTLAAIDAFTANFSSDEIKDSIRRSNMSNNEYLDGTLKIISDVKHNLRIITKDIYAQIIELQSNEEELEQPLKNKLFGGYKKSVESLFTDKDVIKELLERFKQALRKGNKKEIFSIIGEIPYIKSRNIYLIIYDYLNREKVVEKASVEKTDLINEHTNFYKANHRDNLRILEKLNDVA